MKKSLLPIVFTSFILLASSSTTQGKNQKSGEIDFTEFSIEELLDIDVSSTTKTDVELRKAPGTIYTYSKEDFKNYGIKTINDLYWFMPGVQPFQYKKNSVVVIRGVIERFNNRVQHIVDGVLTRNGYYNHEEFDDFIPIHFLALLKNFLDFFLI